MLSRDDFCGLVILDFFHYEVHDFTLKVENPSTNPMIGQTFLSPFDQYSGINVELFSQVFLRDQILQFHSLHLLNS
jgi:hypothetical protein